MNKNEAKNIWDKFKITIDGDPNNINVLGVDLGDGEYCVVRAYSEPPGKIKTARLDVDNTGNHKKDFTAYYKTENVEAVGQSAVNMKKQRKDGGGENGELYINFKRPPGTAEIEQMYGGGFDTLTHCEVMQRNFSKIINDIFEYNESLRDCAQTVLFVGRPSSRKDTGWAKYETEYQELLKERFNIKGYVGKAEVVILSEAQAALASELINGGIAPNETVLIIDGGSSTFDAVLIQEHSVRGEYSRQLGAAMIETNMLKQYCDDPEAEIEDEEIRKLDLRERKERYFGDNGDNGTSSHGEGNYDSYTVRYKKPGDTEYKKTILDIDKEMMDKAIYKTPVFVYASDPAADDYYNVERKFISFFEALRDFIAGIKDQLVVRHNVTLDKIIMTGGATVMPFVGACVKELLVKEPRRSKAPSYSVAEGLAYMGFVELKKRVEFDAVKKNISDILTPSKDMYSDEAFTLYYKLSEKVSDVMWRQRIKTSLDNWMQSTTDSSMELWWDSVDKTISASDIVVAVQGWFDENVLSAIKKTVQDHFSAIIKGAGERYKFDVDSGVIGQAAERFRTMKIEINKYVLRGFWKGLLGANWDEALPQERREHVFNDTMSRESKVREKIEEQIRSDCRNAASEIISLINDALGEQLEKYIDGITPYFITE
jgi:hypothetical protein